MKNQPRYTIIRGAFRLPDGEASNIHNIYEIDGNTLKLKFDSWKLTIAPDPT
jgi:hypothetical protein